MRPMLLWPSAAAVLLVVKDTQAFAILARPAVSRLTFQQKPQQFSSHSTTTTTRLFQSVDIPNKKEEQTAATASSQDDIKTRVLGSQELLMLPRQYAIGPDRFPQMTHVCAVTWSATPSPAVLEQAVQDAMNAHPLLTAHVQGDGEPDKRIDLMQMVRQGEPNPCTFVTGNVKAKDVLVTPDLAKDAADLEAQWQATFNRDLDDPESSWCRLSKGPLWKLTWHRTSATKSNDPCTLVFSMNHAISDQSSVNRLADQILQNVASLEARNKIEPASVVHTEMPVSVEDSVLGLEQRFSDIQADGFSVETVKYVLGKAAEGFKEVHGGLVPTTEFARATALRPYRRVLWVLIPAVAEALGRRRLLRNPSRSARLRISKQHGRLLQEDEEDYFKGYCWDPCPCVRFTLWEDLDVYQQEHATTLLLYDEDTWNQPTTNNLEALSYWSLETAEQQAVNDMGFAGGDYDKDAVDEEGWAIAGYQWDCHCNHYGDYSWDDLKEEDEGVQDAYATLGWDEKMWDDGKGVPDSEDKWWIDLTDEEKHAAHFVCYFEELWNLEPADMTHWTQRPQPPLPPTPQPTAPPTPQPTKPPTLQPTQSPTPQPTVPPTPQPTVPPTPQPTVPPTPQPTESPTTESPTPQPTETAALDTPAPSVSAAPSASAYPSESNEPTMSM